MKVLSVLQEFTDDPMGKLMEGFFECIDQYESELNGLRTSAAMREAVLNALADQVCTEARAGALASRHGWPVQGVLEAWRTLVTSHEVGRAYVLHLIERIEVHGERIVVTPKGGGRNETAVVMDG